MIIYMYFIYIYISKSHQYIMCGKGIRIQFAILFLYLSAVKGD